MNCQLQVYKGGWDVCQLRLDFLHFDLGPPGKVLKCVRQHSVHDMINLFRLVNYLTFYIFYTPDPWSGQCNKDAFLVTGSAYSPPVICGKNTGQHSMHDTLSDGL